MACRGLIDFIALVIGPSARVICYHSMMCGAILVTGCFKLILLLITFSMPGNVESALHNSCAGKTLLRSGDLTCAERQHILDVHNTFRQNVAQGRVHGQPAAAHMLQMVWDDELAAVAQRWANRCVMDHDHGRNVARFPVGQNIASTWTTATNSNPSPDFTTQIGKWFNEVTHYGFYKSLHSIGTGHYSQIVWGDTFLIGCGYSYYYDRSLGYTKLYICNYGPGGNIVGYQPYSAGTPACQLSGLTPSARYTGLCEVHGFSSLGSTCSYRPTTYYRG